MTIDKALLAQVDRLVKAKKTTRSAFARAALKEAIKHHEEAELDRKFREGYLKHPVQPGEFDWEDDEESWPD